MMLHIMRMQTASKEIMVEVVGIKSPTMMMSGQRMSQEEP
jgi:hypothetical protein